MEHGLHATTFARVATAAGISVGLIQHYFASRDELLRFVYADALSRRDDRVAVHIDEGEAAERPIRDILTTAVRELLPSTRPAPRSFHITQNLYVQALHDPAAGEVAVSADQNLHLRASVAVTNGKECGEVEPGVDADTAAARILATAYGLATRLALEDPSGARAPARSGDRVDAVLDPVFAAVFTGRCHLRAVLKPPAHTVRPLGRGRRPTHVTWSVRTSRRSGHASRSAGCGAAILGAFRVVGTIRSPGSDGPGLIASWLITRAATRNTR